MTLAVVRYATCWTQSNAETQRKSKNGLAYMESPTSTFTRSTRTTCLLVLETKIGVDPGTLWCEGISILLMDTDNSLVEFTSDWFCTLPNFNLHLQASRNTHRLCSSLGRGSMLNYSFMMGSRLRCSFPHNLLQPRCTLNCFQRQLFDHVLSFPNVTRSLQYT